jgi:O-antigen/teichoic acid export membrane protein
MAWFRRYSQNPFIRNIAVMFSGNGLAMVFPFIMAPLISRIYTPADFAGFELFVKIVTLIGIVGSLRLEYAILLPKEYDEARALARFCFKLLFRISLVSGAILILFNDNIAQLLENSDLANILWLSPIAIFFFGSVGIFNQFLFRSQLFNQVGAHKVTAAVANHGSKYMFGVFSPTAFGLSLGQVLGFVAPAVAFFSIKKVRVDLLRETSKNYSAKYFLNKYKDFTRINSAHAFFDEGQKAALLFIISVYYGQLALGLFAFAFRYIRVPLQVFGAALAQVLNERWARSLNEGQFSSSEVVKTSGYLALVAFVPFALLFFFGEPVFHFVFGEDWSDAGRYAEIMSPWLFLNFVVSPLSSLPLLLRRQGTFFVLAVVGNSLTLLLVLLAGVNAWDFESVLWIMVATNALLMLVSLFWLISISQKGRPSEAQEV